MIKKYFSLLFFIFVNSSTSSIESLSLTEELLAPLKELKFLICGNTTDLKGQARSFYHGFVVGFLSNHCKS